MILSMLLFAIQAISKQGDQKATRILVIHIHIILLLQILSIHVLAHMAVLCIAHNASFLSGLWTISWLIYKAEVLNILCCNVATCNASLISSYILIYMI